MKELCEVPEIRKKLKDLLSLQKINHKIEILTKEEFTEKHSDKPKKERLHDENCSECDLLEEKDMCNGFKVE